MPNEVVVLGAGFSKAVSSGMPLTDALGTSVLEKLRLGQHDLDSRILPSGRGFSNGYFEAWLSKLAEPQPYLDEANNLRNRSTYSMVAAKMYDALFDPVHQGIWDARQTTWLLKLLTMAHEKRFTIITFNYDLLLEFAIVELMEFGGFWDREFWPSWKEMESRSVTFNELVRTPVIGNDIRPDRLIASPTFSILKLHGSLDTFWRAGDTTGSTVLRVPLDQLWDRDQGLHHRSRFSGLSGLDPYIVPPTTAKSLFYANPVIRSQWEEAYRSMAKCERIALLGYSLPVTDLVTANLLEDGLRRDTGSTPIVDIANLNPDTAGDILGRLSDRGLSLTEGESLSGEDAIKDYVRSLEVRFAKEVFSDIDKLGGGDDNQVSVGRSSVEESSRVMAVRRDDNNPKVAHLETARSKIQAEGYPYGPFPRDGVKLRAIRDLASAGVEEMVVDGPSGERATVIALGMKENLWEPIQLVTSI